MKYLSLVFSKAVFPTAIKVALVIGTLLALINHFPAISTLSLSAEELFQILLTYFVPFCVSAYSSIKIILNQN